MNHLDLAHHMWAMFVQPGDTCIDATAGNGHDSLALAKLAFAGGKGKLIMFDIQCQALENTRDRLKEYPQNQLFFYEMCHSRMAEVVAPQIAKLIAFNLGYLPGGDKSRTTERSTTICALKASLSLVAPNGAISITCYPGHEEGLFEEEAVLAFCRELDPRKWLVSSHTFLNKPRHPHLLFLQPF